MSFADYAQEHLNSNTSDGLTMELPKKAEHAITLASVRAKLFFDTYRWEWESGVPSVKQIEDTYKELAVEAFNDAVKGLPGIVSTGRLSVNYTNDDWTFQVDIADTYDYSLESNSSRKLANSLELDGEENSIS